MLIPLAGGLVFSSLFPAAGATNQYTFVTLAGSTGGAGSLDGTNSAARFDHPSGVAVDAAGNLCVADTGNSTIRQIGPDGTVATLAGLAGTTNSTDGTGGAARFYTPSGTAVDSAGNVYVADEGNYTIRKITPAGAVTTLAGKAGNAGSADGTNSAARFGHPSGVALDTADNVYVADWGNHTIRKITPAGLVTTFAGKAGNAGSADGTGSNARFNQPSAVVVDNATNVYVADTGNCTIRKITPAGVVTTLAGKPGYLGSADGSGSAARFGSTNAGPNGLAVDFFGNVYVADTGNNTIRQVTPYGVVTTLAGQAGITGSTDATGTAALLNYPSGVAADSFGNVWVADTGNNTIRQIAPGGVVTTWAGQAAVTGSADATGTAARFFNPFGMAVDGAANIYVADAGNNTVRLVSPYGAVRTLAGQAGTTGSADGNGGAAQFNDPTGIAVDGSGNLFVADAANGTIREITGDTTVTTLAGRAGQPGNADGNGSTARFYYPSGLTVDGSGNIWLADTGNSTVRQITAGPTITTLAGQADSPGSGDGLGSMAQFYYPYSVAVNSAGVAYVADTYNHTVRQIEIIDLFFATEITVTTLAGQAGTAGGADGNGGSAQFNYPEGIAVDTAGNIYVADTANNTIRLVTSGGTVTTLAGLAGSPGNADGTGGAARFNRPSGVALDSAGNIYVADTFNQCIRKGVPTLPDQPVIDAAAGLVGQTRQLDTTPQTATAWRWNLLRRPANSTAMLSSTTIRNPTFTPDVADLYVFQLRASNAAGKISLFTVSFTATHPVVPPVLSTVNWANQTCRVTLQSNSGFSYTLEYKDALSLTNWLTLPTLTGNGAVLTLTDPAATNRQRFYRVRMQ
jgi:sugar lactone lactonase YvrE